MKRIDAHQHFWKYDTGQYPWIQNDWPIRRDFLPEHLEPHLEEHQLDGSVVVQARQTLEETEWLLALARDNPRVAGVVGWVDLRSPQVDEQLKRFAGHPKFAGVRHVVQDEPDDRFLLLPEFLNGIETLAKYPLTYDILIFPKQLPAAIEFVKRFPEMRLVLDHIAKPNIKDGEIQPWKDQIQELAAHPNCHCKVSGMITEAEWRTWRPEQFEPYLDAVFKSFGADRLMYGSDWPVCLLSGEYQSVYQLADQYLQTFSANDREKFFGLNASRFYGLEIKTA